MQQLRKTFLGVLMGAGLAVMPLQAAQAVEAAEACNKAVGQFYYTLLKEIGKAIKATCSGKEPSEQSEAKIFRAMEKLNKTDEEHDCGTNGDPDLALTFPVDTSDIEPFFGLVQQFMGQCDGEAEESP